jgi:hypothetical protein
VGGHGQFGRHGPGVEGEHGVMQLQTFVQYR